MKKSEANRGCGAWRVLFLALVVAYAFFVIFPFRGFESFFFGAGRYSFHDGFCLKDEWKGMVLEPNCFSYEYKFPFLYTYGVSGYTKTNIIPFVANFKKVVNEGYYDTIPDPSLDWPVKSIKELKSAYGDAAAIFFTMEQIDSEDKEIFASLRERGMRSYSHMASFTWKASNDDDDDERKQWLEGLETLNGSF